MEERKIHEIIVFEVDNKYILGRISGMIMTMSDCEKHYGNFTGTCPECGVRYTIIKTVCTEGQFEKIKDLLEKEYPGKCKFN